MAKNNQKKKKQPQPEVDYYGIMISRFHKYLDANTPQKNRNLAIFWGILTVVLMVASSFPLPESLRWASAVVGTPAGIILFFLLAGIIRETSLSDLPAFTLREKLSHKRRMNLMFAIAGGFLILMLFFVVYVPYGVGGAIVIVGVLFAYYFLRKTDDEKELDRLGLLDPRDYPEAYLDSEEEESDETDYEDSDEDDSLRR